MEKLKRVCPKCSGRMHYILCTPTYVCILCGRMETESGFIINGGRDVPVDEAADSRSVIADGG
jgi:hypothetical protein